MHFVHRGVRRVDLVQALQAPRLLDGVTHRDLRVQADFVLVRLRKFAVVVIVTVDVGTNHAQQVVLSDRGRQLDCVAVLDQREAVQVACVVPLQGAL